MACESGPSALAKEITMANSEIKNGRILTPEARLSFPAIWEPKDKIEKAKGREYSCNLLFPKGADLSALRKLAFDTVVAKFGPDKGKWAPNLRVDWKTYLSRDGKDGWPFRDGDMVEYDGYAGNVFIKAGRAEKDGRPLVVAANLDPIIDQAEIYAGCYVRALLSCYAWHNAAFNTKGFSFALQGIQKIRDGEPFGARRATIDDFEPYEAASEAAEGYTDDISF